MALEYQNIDLFNELSDVRDEYIEWYTDLISYIAYMEESKHLNNIQFPEAFETWRLKLLSDNGNGNLVNPVQELFQSAQHKFQVIFENLQNDIKPDYKSFSQFKNNYNGFMSSLVRLIGSHNQRITDNDEDKSDNGEYHHKRVILRSAIDIAPDMEREMQRLSRNGNPFALAMVRIDGFEKIADLASAIDIASENIMKSIRPFDDAYFIEKGYFLLSLKHADMVGADAAVARLQQSLMLDETNVDNITISCCMAEPVTGDEITNLMETMRDDLRKHRDDKEAVLKFLDISPLQRFITNKS